MPDVTLTSMLPDPKCANSKDSTNILAKLDVVSDYFLIKFAKVANISLYMYM